MFARPFLLGVGAGACLVAGVILAVGRSPSAPSFTASGPSNPAGSAPSDTSLEAEVDNLKRQLAQARRSITRTDHSQVQAAEATAKRPLEPVEAKTSETVASILVGEFRSYLQMGFLRRWALSQPDTVAEYMMDRWMSSDQPDRALGLMQLLDSAEGVSINNYGNYVGRKLLEAGDSALAKEAFMVGLRNSPGDWESVRNLMTLDPAAALLAREQSTGSYESDSQRLTQDAVLMLAAGRRDEALAIIDDLMSRNELAGEAWDLLVKTDPKAAEERLRGRTFDDADEEMGNQLLLLRAIKDQGRSREARDAALALLNGEHGSPQTARRLAALFPDLALDWLQKQSISAPSVAVWAGLGQMHANAKRTQQAVGAYLEAWNLNPTDSDYGRKLLSLAPNMIPQIVSRALSNRDDELIGDVADKLWQQGRTSDAFNYWQQAMDIDPGDSEWSNKVNAVREGRAPM